MRNDVPDDAEAGKTKTMVFICDGDETLKDPESEGYDPGDPTEPYQYNAELVAEAKSKNITIYCINEGMIESSAMKRMASETGGLYFHATKEEEILEAMNTIRSNTLLAVDTTDTDGDGLYDVYEKNGMLTSNGELVYSNPNDKFSIDKDKKLNDYEMMGGAPSVVRLTIDGKIYYVEVFHPRNTKLSSEFIYVDGRMNSDGKRYYGEMGYIPVSNSYLNRVYLQDQYFKPKNYSVINFKGAANIHNSLKSEWDLLSDNEKIKKNAYYKALDSLILLEITDM